MKFNEFVKMVWEKIKDFIKKILSPFMDREWHLDPYKIGGFLLYAGAYYLTQITFKLATTLSDAKIGVLGGLIAGFVTAGTFLFQQGRKSDDTLGK
jgi:hypothetical protein